MKTWRLLELENVRLVLRVEKWGSCYDVESDSETWLTETVKAKTAENCAKLIKKRFPGRHIEFVLER